MARLKYNVPLTEQEKEFAVANHNLVLKFMFLKNLVFEEWYGLVAIGYIKAIKSWFEKEELHKYCFSTIAFKKMFAEISNECKKKRIQAISLDSPIQGTENFALSNIVTEKNLIYIPYLGDDDVNITYDVNLPPKARNSDKRSEEIIAVEEFLVGDKKNMCFEYETEQLASKKCELIQAARRRKKCQELYDVYRVKNCVYIVKTEQMIQCTRQKKGLSKENDNQKIKICENQGH